MCLYVCVVVFSNGYRQGGMNSSEPWTNLVVERSRQPKYRYIYDLLIFAPGHILEGVRTSIHPFVSVGHADPEVQADVVVVVSRVTWISRAPLTRSTFESPCFGRDEFVDRLLASPRDIVPSCREQKKTEFFHFEVLVLSYRDSALLL